MSQNTGLSRRDFLKTGAQAAGLAVAFYLPPPLNRLAGAMSAATTAAATAARPATFEPNAYLTITRGDPITLWVTRSEMGQGVRTTLPMILAEELEVDLAGVRLEQAATVPRFKGIRLRTSGSGSSAGTWATLRRAAATAREMLISAASQTWKVERSECRAENGAVVHAPSGRRAGYGELADAASKVAVPADVPLKEAAKFRVVGRATKRLDGPSIVTGGAVYGMDVRRPGMRYAVVARCPYLGGRVKRWDGARAKAVPGVSAVVPVGAGLTQGIAVVGRDTWSALKGRDALDVEWDPGPNRGFGSDAFAERLRDALTGPGYKVRHEGDAVTALETSARRIEAIYECPFQAHASLEPMNCTADARKDACEIWVPTQAPERAQEWAAKVLGIAPEKVKVNVTLLGGGFGRRLVPDEVPEAVEVSRAVGAPVQVVWTRADDMRYGYFHPAAAQKIKCGLDAGGKPIAWLHMCAGSDLSVLGPPQDPANPNRYEEDGLPWGAYDNPYNLPAMKVDYAPVESPVPTGPWRAVFYPASVFARESFVDEMAKTLEKDPIRLRVEMLEPGGVLRLGGQAIDRGRLKRVLEVAAEKSGWSKPPARTGGRRTGRGVACNVYDSDSYIAEVAEVSVGPGGDVRVHRIVCVVDCGQVINPLGLEGQAESGILWGLSAALRAQITFRDGGAVESSYRDYGVVRFDQSPVIETHILPSAQPPGGFGEHTVPMAAPAVANAIFAATGRRVRRLPLALN